MNEFYWHNLIGVIVDKHYSSLAAIILRFRFPCVRYREKSFKLYFVQIALAFTSKGVGIID